MSNRIRLLLRITALIPFIFIFGCSEHAPVVLSDSGHSDALRTSVNAPKDLLRVNSIFIAPPIPGKQASVISKDTEKQIYETMREASASELTLETKFLDRTAPSGSSPVSLARAHGADAALVTTIHRYIERKGNSIGVSEPASVSFEMSLVRLSDSKIIWESSYSYVDSSLSEDIISYGKKLQEKGGTGGWTTAAKLLERGAKEGFRDLTQKRNVQFMSGSLR